MGWWYGKAPGLDRATDALRHAQHDRYSPRGWCGALSSVNDPVAKSSTIPGTSEMALADLGMPTLFPADPHEVLQYTLHAVAMSRESGLWTALKIVTNVADGAGIVQPSTLISPNLNPDAARHVPNANLVPPVPVGLETSAQGERLERARAYARANGLDVIDSKGPQDRIGVVAAGKTYLDIPPGARALRASATRYVAVWGYRLLKLGMVVSPLDPEVLREFARGLDRDCCRGRQTTVSRGRRQGAPLR